MTYADELRAELERQLEFRKVTPIFMRMIDAYAEAKVNEVAREADRLRRDRLTLALRLEGEDRSTFAPETLRVMDSMRSELAAAYMDAVSA